MANKPKYKRGDKIYCPPTGKFNQHYANRSFIVRIVYDKAYELQSIATGFQREPIFLSPDFENIDKYAVLDDSPEAIWYKL